jgi:rhodanese-related sulfurtransferase
MHYISPIELNNALLDGLEIALLDVRDKGDFVKGHLWLACNLPITNLELSVRRLVPNPKTRLVLCDDNSGIAERSHHILSDMNFDNIQILKGGVNSWADEKLPLIHNDYVAAHVFGYQIEKNYQLPTISAVQLKSRLNSGEDIIVVDARDTEDYKKSSTTVSIGVPVVELPYVIPELANNQNTVVVVHCAGITRAALGAQTLRNAGIKNPIMSLVDGIKGWFLEGYDLCAGMHAYSSTNFDTSKQVSDIATKFAALYEPSYQTQEELTQWCEAFPERSYYLVDIRSREEYLDKHFPGAMHVPGGELAGMTIDHLATYNARIYLFDNPEFGRAEITANWMIQQGWNDIVIVSNWTISPNLVSGPGKNYFPEIMALELTTINVDQLNSGLQEGAFEVIDVSSSAQFENYHIPGAHWTSRSAIYESLDLLDSNAKIVLTSHCGETAKLVGKEIGTNTSKNLLVLEGGNLLWKERGYSTEAEMTSKLTEVNDHDDLFKEYEGESASSIRNKYQKSIERRHLIYEYYLVNTSVLGTKDSVC